MVKAKNFLIKTFRFLNHDNEILKIKPLWNTLKPVCCKNIEWNINY